MLIRQDTPTSHVIRPARTHAERARARVGLHKMPICILCRRAENSILLARCVPTLTIGMPQAHFSYNILFYGWVCAAT